MRKVLIIGGGASGTLVAINLALLSKHELSVVIAEPANELGRGIAYSTKDPSHLLNVPAGRMSALPDSPDHFCQWSGLQPDSFAQRMTYGQYLNSTFEQVKIENQKVKFQHLQDVVTSISWDNERLYRVKFEDSLEQEFDFVILAIGHGEPITHPLFQKHEAASAFLLDSWRDEISPIFGTMACIGTGLTFIDHALSYLRLHPENKVIGISRTGSLPKTHLAKRAPALEVPPSARTSPMAIRNFIESSSDWRAAQDGIRHELPEIWNSWSDSAKDEFLKSHQRWWNVHRHRISPEIDLELQTAIKHGRIQIIKGELTSIEQSSESFQIKTNSGESISAEVIVNCLGYQVNGRRNFLAKLIEQGLAVPGPLGLGIKTKYPNYTVIGGKGVETVGLFALGPILLGERYETTAIPELRVQARDLALELLSNIG